MYEAQKRIICKTHSTCAV